MLAHRLRRWSNFRPAMGQCRVFAGKNPSTDKLPNSIFHPLEVVSQLEMFESYLKLYDNGLHVFKASICL